ncbi:MAG: TPM domain-containing protein [Bacteroidia bacterium]|nr:TPM domain-containing protein [Bacteroidia bacterium]
MIYKDEIDATNFFSPEEVEQIVDAIAQAENLTTGEIRLHLENHCPGPALDRARAVFSELNMQETEQRNGVLIYIAVVDHVFAIFGDDGINAKVPNDFWDRILIDMQYYFKHENYLEGVIKTIFEVAGELAEYFPFHYTDRNELPNEISFGNSRPRI